MNADKPFSCDHDGCGKSFKLNCNLIRHRRFHTGERPYSCDFCKKNFSISSNLAQHKRIHTGDKPFQCDICEKTFSRSSNLDQHKRIHTGEKLYSCKICQKSYTERSALSRHSKSVGHIKRMENKSATNENNFVDFVEIIKTEAIKEEINKEESVDDPLSIN